MKHIIVIHGRNIKPAQKPYEDLQKDALLQGFNRVDPKQAKRIKDGKVKVTFVYYGDINNEILSRNKKDFAKLTAKDPDNGNAPCLPTTGIADAIKTLSTLKSFSAATYRKILKNNKDYRYLDELAWAVSTFSSLISARGINEAVIKRATADLGAYLLTRTTGSKVRTRLQEPLIDAFNDKDDICIVAHSMGSIVAYDVLWKLSRMSEYTHVQALKPKVKLFLTIGSPLGEAGVRGNLYDAPERGEDRYPKNIIKDWVNISAKDDFIAHDPTLANDFRNMRTKHKYVQSIKDIKNIYNCYTQNGQSDPHKLYGYLAHDKVAAQIINWMK